MKYLDVSNSCYTQQLYQECLLVTMTEVSPLRRPRFLTVLQPAEHKVKISALYIRKLPFTVSTRYLLFYILVKFKIF